MSRATMLVLNRDYVLSTTKGHSIAFTKGVPVYVPPPIYADAIAIGASPADGSDPDVLEAEVVDTAPSDPSERADLIQAAFEILEGRNEREAFTAAGVPTVAAVSDEVGFKVQAREITAAWQIRNDAKAAN